MPSGTGRPPASRARRNCAGSRGAICAVRLRNLAGAVREHLFEDRDRRIDGDVVLFQQRDEVLHRLPADVDGRAALRHLGESRRCHRLVLHVRHEVEQQEIRVLHFVHPGADAVGGGHPRRDVAADAHAVLVRFVHDGRHSDGFSEL